MTTDRVIVDLVGLGLIGFIAWFFWLVKAKGVKASLSSSGYQEQMVLVKGGYMPDAIVVERGKPVRLNFVRQESDSCSEMVLLPPSVRARTCPRDRSRPSVLPAAPAIRFRLPNGNVSWKSDCCRRIRRPWPRMEQRGIERARKEHQPRSGSAAAADRRSRLHEILRTRTRQVTMWKIGSRPNRKS
jgi:hypothetical protein